MLDPAEVSPKTHSEKLRDPRWQKKRLKILERDKWCCQMCCDSESTLHVHHRDYRRGAEPWEYDDHELVTLCWSGRCTGDLLRLAEKILG